MLNLDENAQLVHYEPRIRSSKSMILLTQTGPDASVVPAMKQNQLFICKFKPFIGRSPHIWGNNPQIPRAGTLSTSSLWWALGSTKNMHQELVFERFRRGLEAAFVCQFYQECSKNVPATLQERSRVVPGMVQKCTRDVPGMFHGVFQGCPGLFQDCSSDVQECSKNFTRSVQEYSSTWFQNCSHVLQKRSSSVR